MKTENMLSPDLDHLESLGSRTTASPLPLRSKRCPRVGILVASILLHPEVSTGRQQYSTELRVYVDDGGLRLCTIDQRTPVQGLGPHPEEHHRLGRG